MGLDEDNKNEEQKKNEKLWLNIRTRILNNGNVQSRSMQSEIDLYDVMFKGYHIEFKGGNEHGNG